MKKALILSCLSFLAFISAYSNTYYSTGSGSPSVTTNWKTNRNGTGSSPSNFTTAGAVFVVQSGHIMSTSANWTVSGTGSKIVIENGGILKANGKTVASPNFEIQNGGTYIHEVASTTFPGSSTRNFATGSHVEIRNWGAAGTALPNPTTWGNLTIDLGDAFNGNWTQGGNLISVAGNLRIVSTGKNTSQLRFSTNQSYTMSIGGDLVIEGGIVEAAANNGNNSQTIILGGSYNQSGGTLQRSGNQPNLIIRFAGENSQFTKTGGTLANEKLNWEVSNGAKLILNSDLPVASSRSLVVNGTLNVQNKQVTGSGSFQLAEEGKFITSHASGVGGSLALTGSLSLGQSATYEFRSATTTPFASIPGNVTAKDIIVDANITINKDVTITGALRLQSGKLVIPPGYHITVSSGAAIEGSGFGSSKHIVTQANHSTGAKGFLRIGNFSGTMTFPVGNGTHYLPVTLVTTGQNDFSVCAYPGATQNGQPNGTAFSETAKKSIVDAIWMVNRNSGSGSPTMTVSWPDVLEGQTFKSVPDAQIGISHYDGSNWDLPFGNGNQLQNTATRPYILSFSPFSVGKSGIPLPLKFGDIKVFKQNNGVQVDWVSFTEINVDRYEIERSADGRSFTTAGHVIATGNGTAKKSYSYIDSSPGTGSVFYRIRGVDNDGKPTYSTVVKLVLNQSSNDLVLYPNPAVGKRISFQLGNLDKGQYQVSVYDLNGKHVYRKSLNHTGGPISQLIELPGNTTKGVYNFRISSTGGGKTDLIKMFVVN